MMGNKRSGVGTSIRRLVNDPTGLRRTELKHIFKFVKKCKYCGEEYGYDYVPEPRIAGVCPVCYRNFQISGKIERTKATVQINDQMKGGQIS